MQSNETFKTKIVTYNLSCDVRHGRHGQATSRVVDDRLEVDPEARHDEKAEFLFPIKVKLLKFDLRYKTLNFA